MDNSVYKLQGLHVLLSELSVNLQNFLEFLQIYILVWSLLLEEYWYIA